MIIFKLIYWFLVENTYCRVKGHRFTVVKDIKITDPNIPFDGVQILKCNNCKRSKMAWYINTKDK